MFFSATLPPKIIQLAQHLLRNPVAVNVTPKSTSVETIEQRVLFVEHGGKRELLHNILKEGNIQRALVFTKTKRTANVVAEKLMQSGIKATAIHGNKSQNARQRALEAFRRKQVHVLVATDVAARGIDIDGITHVVNFDLPLEPESYVHRIGRTGRAGAEGIALSFCTSGERRELRAIEQLIGQKLLMANGEPQPAAICLNRTNGILPDPGPRSAAPLAALLGRIRIVIPATPRAERLKPNANAGGEVPCLPPRTSSPKGNHCFSAIVPGKPAIGFA